SAPHFNYVGDSIICEGVNLGAGSKTSNLRFDNKSVWVNIKGTRIDSERRKLGSIIGPNVQTGINASIMCGKIVGENSVIGAHTLVNEDVPPNTLYYSDPIKGLTIEKNKFY
ncbi:MAG: glucose-1-phosphate thymidylyltransferase, partial [Promethearchaeota archaeon]